MMANTTGNKMNFNQIIGSPGIFETGMDITIFESRLNNFFLANAIVNGVQKRAVLLCSISENVHKVLFSLCAPHTPDDVEYDTLMASLNEYFKPVKSYFAARHTFYQAKRRQDESVSQWGARVKKLASECGFSSELSTVIRDIFVVGMGSGVIQDRLFEEDASKVGVTYSSLMEIATATQTAQNDKGTWIKKENADLEYHEKCNTFNQGERGLSTSEESKPKFEVCGRSNHPQKDCRYKDNDCNNCGSKGHLSTACKKDICVQSMIQNIKVEPVEVTPGIFVSNDAAKPSNSSERLWGGISDGDMLEHATKLEENGYLDDGEHDSHQRKIVPRTSMVISSYVETPLDIQRKKAVINPQNNDEQCFKWAILVKHLTCSHKQTVNKNYYTHENKYNFTGLTFPTPFQEVKIFEKNNPTTSVNVYGLKQQGDKTHTVYPLRVTAEEKDNHFDLLLLTDEKKSHYTYITNLSRLVRAQLTKHKTRIFICKTCFSHFNDQPKKFKLHGQAALDQHKLTCGAHKPILPRTPTAGSTLELRSRNQIHRPSSSTSNKRLKRS